MTRRGVWVSLALLGVCAAAVHAQQRRASTAARDADLPVLLSIEDDRASQQADLDVLLAARRGELADVALRGLGRLERRGLITDLLPYLAVEKQRAAAATALGLSLRGAELDGVRSGQQERLVRDALITAGDMDSALTDPPAIRSIAGALGRLAVRDVESYRAVETFLRKVLDRAFLKPDAPHVAAARGLEALARLNRKVAALEDDTITILKRAARTIDPRLADVQRNALAALIAAQAVDADTLEMVLGREPAEVRRLAMLALSGSGSTIEAQARIGYIRKGLADSSYMVRLEAVRAWTRRGVAVDGCQPLLEALSDQSLHVVLAAIDALGDVCRNDDTITTRMAAEARTPRPQARWQREMHAFVTLAKRDRERARISLLSLAMHTTWQVRMYAARAAAIIEDAAVLARLAADPENNVAEAALPPLRRLAGSDSDQLFVDVLNRRTRTVLGKAIRPYEVIRTAALALDSASSTPALVAALAGALERISAERCETSRDTRVALIDRLARLGSPAQVATLTPLLKDVDSKVAVAAAEVIGRWTGSVPEVEVVHERSTGIPTPEALSKKVRVVFEMERGKFDVELNPIDAPLTRTRFLALVNDGYYDNLTFHRVVANFIIQGGSPGANEYCGDCPFMRDEVGGMHLRGTLGISTRGRDTGDAQIFINLVDNPRLDYDYTVFARICTGMAVVDEIQEGDRIARVQVLPPLPTCGG